MLESMAGATTGVRDALTRYTQAITGSYYFFPSTESLRQWKLLPLNLAGIANPLS